MEVEDEFGIPVEPILAMSDIMAYMETKGMSRELEEMKAYREKYGVVP